MFSTLIAHFRAETRGQIHLRTRLNNRLEKYVLHEIEILLLYVIHEIPF